MRFTRQTSAWREFKFGLRQVRRAIMPDFSLRAMFAQWSTICHDMAESPRLRKLQREKHTESS